MQDEAYPKSPANPTTVRPYARQGHFLMLDHAVIDFALPTLTGPETKVLLFVLRKTLGWGKDADSLSGTQIQQGTGIRSRNTIDRALDGLETKGHVTVHALREPSGRRLPRTIALNRDFEMVVPPPRGSSSGEQGSSFGELGAAHSVGLAQAQEMSTHEDSGFSGESTSEATTTGSRIERGSVEEKSGRNTSSGSGKKPGSKIRGITEDEARERVEAFLAEDSLGKEVREVLRLAAGTRKRGEMAYTVAYNGFVAEVLDRRAAGVSDDDWREGFAAARRAAQRKDDGSPVEKVSYARSVAVKSRDRRRARHREPLLEGAPGASTFGGSPHGDGASALAKGAGLPAETSVAAARKGKLVERIDRGEDIPVGPLFDRTRARVMPDGGLVLVHVDPEEARGIAEDWTEILREEGVRVMSADEWARREAS